MNRSGRIERIERKRGLGQRPLIPINPPKDFDFDAYFREHGDWSDQLIIRELEEKDAP